MPETIIHTDRLTRTFNGVQALNVLSMDVPAHSIIGFLGPKEPVRVPPSNCYWG